MNDLSAGLLDIKIEKNKNKVIMNWLGECININPGKTLYPYFDELIEAFDDNEELEINFSNLQYMKSSIVPYLIKLITKLNKEQINTIIQYNSSSNWQTATFKALLSVVSIMDFIDVIGIDAEKIS